MPLERGGSGWIKAFKKSTVLRRKIVHFSNFCSFIKVCDLFWGFEVFLTGKLKNLFRENMLCSHWPIAKSAIRLLFCIWKVIKIARYIQDASFLDVKRQDLICSFFFIKEKSIMAPIKRSRGSRFLYMCDQAKRLQSCKYVLIQFM